MYPREKEECIVNTNNMFSRTFKTRLVIVCTIRKSEIEFEEKSPILYASLPKCREVNPLSFAGHIGFAINTNDIRI